MKDAYQNLCGRLKIRTRSNAESSLLRRAFSENGQSLKDYLKGIIK